MSPDSGSNRLGAATVALDLLALDAAVALTVHPCAEDFRVGGLADFIGLFAQPVELIAKCLQALESISVGIFGHST